MKTKIQRWGNSLAIRVPKAIAETVGLHRDDELDMEVEDGKVILRPRHGGFRLEELLAGITDENLHAPVDTGEPIGRELL